MYKRKSNLFVSNLSDGLASKKKSYLKKMNFFNKKPYRIIQKRDPDFPLQSKVLKLCTVLRNTTHFDPVQASFSLCFKAFLSSAAMTVEERTPLI